MPGHNRDWKALGTEALTPFIESPEQLLESAVATLGPLGTKVRWVGLTDKRFIIVKTSPRDFGGRGREYADLRERVTVETSSGARGTWTLTLNRVGDEPIRLKFHPMFREQGKRIGERLSSGT